MRSANLHFTSLLTPPVRQTETNSEQPGQRTPATAMHRDRLAPDCMAVVVESFDQFAVQIDDWCFSTNRLYRAI